MVCENCQKLADEVDLWKTKYKKNIEEKYTWNLADNMIITVPLSNEVRKKCFIPIDVKTFIQKVKEDIMNSSVAVNDVNDVETVKQIIDKRAGDLG